MDPRQFVRASNIQVQREREPGPITTGQVRPLSSGFNELRIGTFQPGIYNVLVNDKFTKNEQRVDIKYILKQRPKGHAQLSSNLTIDINEIKGIYGRFQTGLIHTSNFGMRGDLNKKFFSAQFGGYITDGINRKNFSFNIYTNGKIRFSGGFLGSKNLKKQPEALRKYIIDTYTEKHTFLYNEIEYNNIAGQFSINANFKLPEIARDNPLKSERVTYEPELQLPHVYLIHEGYNFILSSKSGKLGSGNIQIQGEKDPDNLERAYTIGVKIVQQLHKLGYTIGLVNKNVNPTQHTLAKKVVTKTTCPKPRRPPCKEGFEVRKNPQGYDCCFKKPKRKPAKKKASTKSKNTKITYDKDGTMKIGGLKCERLTKPVLLEVAKKLGVVGVKNKNKKQDICKALDTIEKGNSQYKIDNKLCREMKKEQLIALAISKGISINDTDTVKILCQKLQNKPNTPNSPNALANELEKILLNKKKKENRANKNIKRKINNTSIKNDLVKLYGKKWMKQYGNVMNLNKNVREVKNKLTNMENKKQSVSSNGIIKKMAADKIKKNMVKNWKLDKQQELKKLLLQKEANKIYGKFGKNEVNKIVNFAMSLPKTPNLNSKRIIDFIKIGRELRGQPPLALNKKRVIPPKPKLVKRKPRPTKKVIKRAPIKKKSPAKPVNKVVRRLNFKSNSNSNSNSNSRSRSKSNARLLNEIYANFEKELKKKK